MLSAQPRSHSPSPTQPPRPQGMKPLIAGALVLVAAAAVVFDMPALKTRWLPQNTAGHAITQPQGCTAVVEPTARLSREQLAKVLTVPERDPKSRITDIVAEPYCRLPELEVRSGVVALREVYPLAFDPSTRLVILYEDDEYAGYRFNLGSAPW